MAYSKTAVTPLLMHWNCCNLALSHWFISYFYRGCWVCQSTVPVLSLSCNQYPEATKMATPLLKLSSLQQVLANLGIQSHLFECCRATCLYTIYMITIERKHLMYILDNLQFYFYWYCANGGIHYVHMQCQKLGKMFTGLTYNLLLSIMVISDVYRGPSQ